MDLKETAKKLPRKPGIYLMKNSLGTVLYVGKARNLKTRVSQYFQNSKQHTDRINEMIQQIDSFETITVDTELEAFLLEGKTIKELKPRYNKLLKNYLNYQYIKIDQNRDYPIPEIVAQPGGDKAMYFGPFTSRSSLENALLFFKDHFKVRKCSFRTTQSKPSGCLNLQLGNCYGPCTEADVSTDYNKEIQQIILLLQNKDQQPIRDLKAKMLACAERLEFERAAAYREQLKGIRHLLYMQKLIKISSYGRNIIAVEKYGDNLMKLFLIKGNRLLRKEELSQEGINEGFFAEKLKSLSIDCFKLHKSMERTLSQEDMDEAQIIYSYLKKRKNGIISMNIPASRIETLSYIKLARRLLNK